MYSIELVTGLCVGAAALGALIVYLLTRGGASRGRIQDLESRLEVTQEELEGARTELTDYRKEVFDQFSETAIKFKAVNDSHTDLHRQLANSARLLCGDDATGVLLEGPRTLVLETDLHQADGSDVTSLADTNDEINPDADVSDEVDQRNAFADMGETKAVRTGEDPHSANESIVEQAQAQSGGSAEADQQEAQVIEVGPDETADPRTAIDKQQRAGPDVGEPGQVDEEIVIADVPVLSDIAASDEAAEESQKIDGQVPTSTIERALNVRRDSDRHQNG